MNNLRREPLPYAILIYSEDHTKNNVPIEYFS